MTPRPVTLLALDPSIAHVGWAVLRRTPTPTPELLGIGTWHVAASDDEGSVALETRLRSLRQQVLDLHLDGYWVTAHSMLDAAIMERPVTSTVYARNRARGKSNTIMAASRERQELATGCLWATLEWLNVPCHFAAPVQLRYRTADVLSRMVKGLPNRTSEHARAALALGLAALADGRRTWEAA